MKRKLSDAQELAALMSYLNPETNSPFDKSGRMKGLAKAKPTRRTKTRKVKS